MSAPFILGWEEWVALPNLGLPSIKAKVDTGAKTSALHASLIEPFGSAAIPMVRFVVHPVPGREDIAIACSSPVLARREVTSSNGDRETRFVIAASLKIGERGWPIEVTLTNRASMHYRMLLGRQAIREDVFVDPTASFLQPKLSYKPYKRMPRSVRSPRVLRLCVLTRRKEAASIRRLAEAASERGHVLETMDFNSVSLSFPNGETRMSPRLTANGEPCPHYDGVIPRVGERGLPFAAAVVRQLEMMGSYALNGADALDRLRDPLAVLQRLVSRGVPVQGWEASRHAGAPHPPPSRAHCLVVGGEVVAMLASESSSLADASTERDRARAVEAAGALDLGLAAVGIGDAEGRRVVTRVDAVPPLRRFEKATDTAVADAIVAFMESRAPWRAQGADPPSL